MGQQQSDLALAKAIDNRIEKLNDLPGDIRSRAIKNLAFEIRQQPVRYAAQLAFNLAADGAEGSDIETLQEITNTLAETLRNLPINDTDHDDGFEMLAELVRYDYTRTSLNDPRYKAAMAKLQVADQNRSESDFTLTDIEGKNWNLRSLRGRIVLVNFWATWCPPCRREIPDLNAIYKRFQSHGLAILAISDEEASMQRGFLSQYPIAYPLLLDPGRKTREQFAVRGIPKSFVYNRERSLVAESIDRPSMQGFMDMLGHAGLR